MIETPFVIFFTLATAVLIGFMCLGLVILWAMPRRRTRL